MTEAVDQQSQTAEQAPIQAAEIEPPSAPMQAFATLCLQLAQTTKKLEKRALMAAYLRGLSVDDAARAALYLSGTPFAQTDRRQLQLGGSTLGKAVAELTGADAATMHQAYRRHGDLGDAAFDLLSDHYAKQHSIQPGLTLIALEDALTSLALARGPSAKLRLLLPLLASATPLEAKYIIKLASGDMRTGVKQSLVEEAIAACYDAAPAEVRRAVMLNGSLAEVVRMAAGGTLSEATMRLFHPLGFMLASPVDSVDEALARFAQEVALESAETAPETVTETVTVLDGAAGGTTAAAFENTSPASLPDADLTASILAAAPASLRAAQLEDKYDGMRAQLHCGDRSQPGRVGLFSRNREDLAESFPDLIEAFAGFTEEVILDGEILAWSAAPVSTGDPSSESTGRALPFASLQQRLGRKRVSAEMREATPVIFMAFDLLYQRGELLLEHPLSDRRARLAALVSAQASTTTDPAKGQVTQSTLFAAPAQQPTFPRLLLAPATQLANAAQLDAAYTEARSRGNEGVMLKASASLYQPGRRGLAWLKLKRELGTLDVVITGAEFGHGRRAGVLSDYTFAVRSALSPGAEEALLNVGKAYSGLTDREVDELSRLLHEHTIEDHGSFRTVEPVVVLEVAFNNVMRSSRHASGFALRFPRILRLRTDKPVAEIDTLERVEEIYASQPDKPAEV